VTGGAGFVGANLAPRLREQGWTPVAYDDLSAGHRTDAERAGYEDLVEADIVDAAALSDAARGASAVVHLAARTGVIDSIEDPRRDLEVNAIGTLNALLAARDVGATAFVFASSSAPLGETEAPVHEDLPAGPLSPYGASKLAGEGLCTAFAGSYGLSTTVLRFSNVYGPWSYHKGSVVAHFMKRIVAGEPLVVYGDGEQTRDFVYVDDLCAGITSALDAGCRGEIVQLGSGTETSVNALVAALRESFADTEVDVRHEPPRAGEILRTYADISKARRMLGYAPNVDLATGLASTRDWFLGQAR